jgi:hypothetical protein
MRLTDGFRRAQELRHAPAARRSAVEQALHVGGVRRSLAVVVVLALSPSAVACGTNETTHGGQQVGLLSRVKRLLQGVNEGRAEGRDITSRG